jgi:hypothetical protein
MHENDGTNVPALCYTAAIGVTRTLCS